MSARARRVHRLEFTADEPSAILEQMTKLAAAGDGWVNLTAASEEDERPTSLGFLTLFGGGSSGLTMATWIPRRELPHGESPMSLGISHTTGRRVVEQLTPQFFPERWVVEQDHPRRGLVMYLPDNEPHAAVLSWSLHALLLLSPRGAIQKWRAEIHSPLGS